MSHSPFVMPPELQQFISSVPSKSSANIVWDLNFPDGAPVLPLNPNAVRRMLTFAMGDYSAEATPTYQYNCYIENLDGSDGYQITFPRGEVI